MWECLVGHDNTWLLLCHNICPTRMWGILKLCKKKIYTRSLALPCMQSSTLRKDTPYPPLAIAHIPKDILQNRWQHLQSNLHWSLQLVLSLKLPNANVPKKPFSATLQVILNMSKQLMHEWHQIRTQHFDGIAKSQEIARNKLPPSFEMPHNAKKKENSFLEFCFLVLGHKPFSHQHLVWRSPWKHWWELPLWALVLANALSVEAIQIVTSQSVVHA